MRKVISGKDEVITRLLTAFLAGGHILLDDVPGVGKTTLAVALSKATGLACRRIQFTPDVMPSDIVGFSVYDRESGNMLYRPGILTGTNLLLGDEINRTSSRTQSALFEAMEERQITVDGNTYPLADPFTVIATQNCVGTAGTQRLPYAQMDRFMVRLSIGYPDHEAQVQMLKDRQNRDPRSEVRQIASAEDIAHMRGSIGAVTANDSILDYISRLVTASRGHAAVATGISPRGALFIDSMAKAHAWADDRDYVTGGDVQAVIGDVCAHRMLLKSAGGIQADEVLEDIIRKTPVPDRRHA